jgi:hypothetical protein
LKKRFGFSVPLSFFWTAICQRLGELNEDWKKHRQDGAREKTEE